MPVAAQQAQTPPVTAPTRTDLDPIPAERTQARPSLTVEGDIERAPCALDAPAYAAIKLTPTEIRFNNLGPVAPEALRETYARYIGSEQPISVLCSIRDAAATKLRALGYVAAVQVPVQKIDNGVVTFEVLYAKVTDVRVVGQSGRSEAVIARYLSKLADGQVFNRYDAERYLLLARDLPGYDVRLALKPAKTGAGDMIAEVSLRTTPLTLDVSAQNYAAESTGRWGGQLRAVFNGLTGMGDRTLLSFYSTVEPSEQKILQFGHDMMVGGEGLRLGVKGTYAWTRPDLGPGLPEVTARTLFANVEASYPLQRTQGSTVRLAGGLDYVDQRVSFAGPFSEDKLRVGYLRLDSEAVDMVGIGPGGGSG